jgi:hypothetical protein
VATETETTKWGHQDSNQGPHRQPSIDIGLEIISPKSLRYHKVGQHCISSSHINFNKVASQT